MPKKAGNNERLLAKVGCFRRRRERAFTMVEIALSIAVVAFALVAILGVLPTGMTVQKDNREDTLISQEGRYWLEAIKSGARGLQDITNYVEQIKIETTNRPPNSLTIENNKAPYLTGPDIISLFSIPKYEIYQGRIVTNRITARVRAITGPATEQSPFSNTNQNSFRYQLQCEITQVRPLPEGFVGELFTASSNNLPVMQFNESMATNLWDVRLVLRWPVVERGSDWFIGNNRKTFRARVSGGLLIVTNYDDQVITDRGFSLRRFAPNKFDVAVVQ